VPRTRLSISLDPDDAQHIKRAAARAGVDISAYVTRAALDAAERDDRAADVFAELDARIDAMERMADQPLAPLVGELSPVETAAIKAQWDAFFRESRHGAA
jgi:uncharacterized protein (DUF1778 family)